eukprot:TRINITY_DN21218_c0_g1_i1.p2 TRINITY_DN21218_c0_g1~~TRINITY_DN21218_c0_g1_i1.p2  ORF type:complete len:250 (+),score=55.03 TRINITY_DN21218_c0_g1_i1:79-828(+)
MTSVVRSARASINAPPVWERPVVGPGAHSRASSAGARLQPLAARAGPASSAAGALAPAAAGFSPPAPANGRPPTPPGAVCPDARPRPQPPSTPRVHGPRPSSGPPASAALAAAEAAGAGRQGEEASRDADLDAEEALILQELEALGARLEEKDLELRRIAEAGASYREQLAASQDEVRGLYRQIEGLEEGCAEQGAANCDVGPADALEPTGPADADDAGVPVDVGTEDDGTSASELARARLALGLMDPC